MKDNEIGMAATTETVGKANKIFTRDELNKIVNTEKTKAIQEYQAKIQAEETEAMARLNAYELKEKALRMAEQKGLDISLLAFIDLTSMTPEKLSQKMDQLLTIFNKAVEQSINERLKEDTPM